MANCLDGIGVSSFHWRLPAGLDLERKALEKNHAALRAENNRLHVDTFDLEAHRIQRVKLQAHAARIHEFLLRLYAYNRERLRFLTEHAVDPFVDQVTERRRTTVPPQRTEDADAERRRS